MNWIKGKPKDVGWYFILEKSRDVVPEWYVHKLWYSETSGFWRTGSKNEKWHGEAEWHINVKDIPMPLIK